MASGSLLGYGANTSSSRELNVSPFRYPAAGPFLTNDLPYRSGSVVAGSSPSVRPFLVAGTPSFNHTGAGAPFR